MAPNDVGFFGQPNTFYRVLSEAINEISNTGFDSAERLAYWTQRIRAAAVQSMTPSHIVEAALRDTLQSAYRAKVEQGAILKFHPGVSRFTVEKIKPRLRAELDRRLMASADLIKLNRAAAIEKTVQRFSGWATSVPPGGSDAVSKAETKTTIRKALAQLPYEERRVATDQGHKFVANLNNIIAVDAGALALTWHSHWRSRNYAYRPDHKERDEHVFVIRGSWAMERGLMKLDGRQYYDEVTSVGSEVNCRCFAEYLYSLRQLPADMVTEKGRAELARVRAELAA